MNLITKFQTQSKMKATQIQDYGPISEKISIKSNIAIPHLTSLPSPQRSDYLIIKTLAVSLAPGDVRTLSGKTRELQGPPSFPYIPGGDCCGIIVELSDRKGKYDKDIDFKQGDSVAVRFFDFPRGCLTEYAIVHKCVCEKVDLTQLSPEAAAALASATPAILIADRVKEGDRVLVFGAGGGVGSHLCQCLRLRNISFLVGVSCDPNRLLTEPVLCDEAFDYTKENVWENEKFMKEPFDVIIDLAGGGWPNILQYAKTQNLIIKSAEQGGRFLTTTPDNPIFEIHSIWAALKLFLFKSLWRACYSRTWKKKSIPAYTYAMSLPRSRSVLTRTLELAKHGKIKACIDGPYPFTTKGVQDAFTMQESRHPKGKVIVTLSDPET